MALQWPPDSLPHIPPPTMDMRTSKEKEVLMVLSSQRRREQTSVVTHFERCPTEVLSNIASNLDDPDDLINFSRATQGTEEAVIHDGALWMKLLRNTFDVNFDPLTINVAQRRAVYIIRVRQADKWKVGKRKPKGHRTRLAIGYPCISLLRQLILESHTGKNGSAGRNMAWLRQHCDDTRTFEDCYVNPANPPPPEKVLIQVMLSYLRFRTGPDYMAPPSSRRSRAVGFCHRQSQMAVYDLPMMDPIFEGPALLTLNMSFLLHCMNFWVRSFCSPASDLYEQYQTLPLEQKISGGGWKTPIVPGSSWPSTKFVGEYCWTMPAAASDYRLNRDPSTYLCDISHAQFGGISGKFPFLSIEFRRPRKTSQWDSIWRPEFELALQAQRRTPAEVESIVQGRYDSVAEGWYHSMYTQAGERPVISMPHAPTTMENQQFAAQGMDHGEPFFGTGWITPLPAQGSIPGFQRFVMVKFYPHEWFSDTSGRLTEGRPYPPRERHIFYALDNIKEDDMQCYEGVILPGNHMIVGRQFPLNTASLEGAMVGMDLDGKTLDFTGWTRNRRIAKTKEQASELSGPFMFWSVGGLDPCGAQTYKGSEES